MSKYAILVEAKVEVKGYTIYHSSLITQPNNLFPIAEARLASSITELGDWQGFVLDKVENHAKRAKINDYDNLNQIVWFFHFDASTIQDQKSFNAEVRGLINRSLKSKCIIHGISYYLIKKPTLWDKLKSKFLELIIRLS